MTMVRDPCVMLTIKSMILTKDATSHREKLQSVGLFFFLNIRKSLQSFKDNDRKWWVAQNVID